MTFERLWPIGFLSLIPIVIIMYLLKEKTEDMKVPSLFLWQEMYRNKEADRPWEKLKHNILLVLQILIILLLTFALMGPGMSLGDSRSENAVIIIDNSASMNTLLSDNKTRLQLAKERAAELIKTYSDDTAFTIIESSDKATMLLSNSSDKMAAIGKVRGIEATNLAGDCSHAVTMAEGMAAADVSVVVFTDSSVTFKNLTGKIYDLSGNPSNLSVDYVTSGYKDDKTVVIAGVTNYSDKEVTTDINVYGDGKIVFIGNETIAPHETKNLFYEGIDFKGTVVAVEINEKDDLKQDNIRYFVNTESNEKKVLLVTEQNLYLEKAVALNKGIDLYKTADTQGFDTFKNQGYSLFIFDGLMPDSMPAEQNLMFVGCDTKEVKEFGIEPVGEYERVKLSNVYGGGQASFMVSKTYLYRCPVWATPIFLSNEVETDTKSPLCAGFIGKQGGISICVIGFDFHSSDFPLSMEFPMLIFGLTGEMASTEVLSDTNIEAGGNINVYARDVDNITIKNPEGKRFTEEANMLKFSATESLGLYEVKAGTEEAVFSVNFPVSESEAGVQSSVINSSNTEVVVATNTNILDFTWIFVELAMLVLAVEWIIYIRQ